jgi:hypothetical protein
MLGLAIYMLFSAFFTLGVTHNETDGIVNVVLKFILSIAFGWAMMPLYIGSWLSLNNK